ncbi:MAG: hypothetical protein WA814_01925 [Candidatus Baltobacteraceae bacterium]
MSSFATGLIAFLCLFTGALLGMGLRRALPDHHLSPESRHLLEIGLGIIGTMAGLVLGLLVASATTSYNAQRSEILDASSKVVLLDRILAHYGPEAEPARRVLRATIERTLERIWPDEPTRAPQLSPSFRSEALFETVEDLVPRNDLQRSLKPAATDLVVSLGQIRWLIYEQSGSTVSLPLLILLVFWFTITFVGFGLFAPRNATTIAALALCALAVSGAIFITVAMYKPFEGVVRIPSTSLREALVQLGH